MRSRLARLLRQGSEIPRGCAPLSLRAREVAEDDADQNARPANEGLAGADRGIAHDAVLVGHKAVLPLAVTLATAGKPDQSFASPGMVGRWRRSR